MLGLSLMLELFAESPDSAPEPGLGRTPAISQPAGRRFPFAQTFPRRSANLSINYFHRPAFRSKLCVTRGLIIPTPQELARE